MNRLQLNSPNGKIIITFELTEKGAPVYQMDVDGAPLLLASMMGLTLQDDDDLLSGFTLVRYTISSKDEYWTPLYGERDRIRDRYHALTVTLKEQEGLRREMHIEFRAYDEGVSFRYVIPEQVGFSRDIVISGERSEFHFPKGCLAYEEHGAEGEYGLVPVEELQPNCERPLTVVYRHGAYLCLTEAELTDYSRMLLSTDADNRRIVVSTLSGLVTAFVGYDNMDTSLTGELADQKVRTSLPFTSPWRVLVIGERPGDLLENNDIVLNLNPPADMAESSWIVPGKLLRDMTISNEGARACVDFAVRHNLQYIMLDWGWYGDPFDDASVCTNEVNDVWYFRMEEGVVYPKLDVKEVVRYANSKGIGVILYLDRRAVEQQLDHFLPVYKEWGVKGIKIGFANTGPQVWTRWLHDVVRRCAEYSMLVNVHDAYRPTGSSRTYPNLLTQEGIRGNEHMPTARHNCILPFTRFVAGAGDYTICYYTDRKKTTHAHQLAMAVVAYSPMQSVFWYDKPSHYEGEPEIDFFARLPVVWNDTRVPQGSIGEFAVIARRSGEEWYVGCITNEEARELTVKLDFLEEDKPYLAYIYSDSQDEQASRTKVTVTIREVRAASVLNVLMAPTGGQAIRLTPKRA
ncbi:glycoside hydrolase family 97 N-terminal domain-containing protein [Paenibacillus tarimensis]